MKNLNEAMYLLLVEKRIDNFSVTELVETYIRLYSSTKNDFKARVFIHRQLYRLVNHGYLLKLGKKNTQKIRYIHTEKFKQHFYNLDNPKAGNNLIPDEEFKAMLNDRLIKYRYRLLISTSEMEEYQSYMVEHPEITALLKSKFDLAKEKKYSYLGRIAAIQNILGECHDTRKGDNAVGY
ncbi:hypothetical protein [Pseudoalteromonas sp. H105]|jgi:hypothetical protein|uniref:hypothetical protein n=1 Tax=Pseudoalteromonas sp. H105 TaxID=1348393 RepID=UPI0007323353|nr:hypothetical protein [Pseudoalteromonas sp. H105]KTF14850.1 hypothetical protein ATS75_12150 [Pseudoalteromonas sp. H105]